MDASRVVVVFVRRLLSFSLPPFLYHAALVFPRFSLGTSRGISTDVPVLSVSWSVVDHSVIIQALKTGLIEHEASDIGGVPRWQSSCPDRCLLYTSDAADE